MATGGDSSGWDKTDERVLAFLARQTARVLELDGTSLRHDRSLVALGLDSLAAAELAEAIATGLGVEVPLDDLLQGPSLAELAAHVAARRHNGATPDAAHHLDDPVPLPPAGDEHPEPAPLDVQAGGAAGDVAGGSDVGRYPVTYGQHALWLIDRLAGSGPAYVIAGAARLPAGIDGGRLQHALSGLVARHPALRSTFAERDGAAEQMVHALPRLDWSDGDGDGWSQAAIAAHLAAAAHRPFDLAGGPLLRAALLRQRATGQAWLLLAVHHIVADFASLGVILDDLGALLGGAAPLAAADRTGGRPLPPLRWAGAGHARREKEALAGAAGERLLAYWRQALPAADPPLDLPADRPRPPQQTFAGAARSVRLERRVAAGLAQLGRAAGATPFMTLLAGFMALLRRHTGQPVLRIGTPATGRDTAELAGQVGYFVNPVVLRSDVADDPTFGQLLARVRAAAIGAFGHRQMPFPLLVERLGGERDASRSPLFQAMFVLYRGRSAGERALGAFAVGARSRIQLGPLALEAVPLALSGAQFELTLAAAEIDGDLALSLRFNSDLFDAATAERLLGHLGVLLAAVAAAGTPANGADGADGATVAAQGGAAGTAAPPLSRLPLLTEAERHQLVVEGGDTRPPRQLGAPAACLHQLFERQAALRPRQPAVVGQGMALTYAELDRRANQLARYLAGLGVTADTPVALCVERSPRLVVALLGILKAGGAYVPLDPAHPAERLGLVLADSAAAVLVTEEHLLEPLLGAGGGGAGAPGGSGGAAGPAYVVCLDREQEWIAAEDPSPVAGPALPENLAYLIYTSGSTGRPKGVGLPHRAVVNFLRAMAERPGLGAGDVVPALTTLSFDIAGLEIYLPLAVGGRVEMMARDEAADGRRLAARLAAGGVTAMQATPATWRLLLDAGWEGQPRLKALCGGEALPWELAAELLARGVELWNVYGPTETAIWSSAAAVVADPAAVPPQGSPSSAPAVFGAGTQPATLQESASGAPAVSGAGTQPAATQAPGTATATGTATGGSVGLGRPIANTRFYVVDAAGQTVPVGAAGELLIGGAGLARGYWRRPDLTAERFVPDPFSAAGAPAPPLLAGGAAGTGVPADPDAMGAAGARLYRTGDLVRRRPHGDLEFLGRIDHQVKVRGFRIELGEIESALLRHAAVGEAAVAAVGAGTDRRLVAFVVARAASPALSAERDVAAGQTGLDVDAASSLDDTVGAAPPALAAQDLRDHLRPLLPEYMVPAAYVVLARLPRNPAGKIDRRALPELAAAAAGAGSAAPPGAGGRPAGRGVPLSPIEELLAGLWVDVLGGGAGGVGDAGGIGGAGGAGGSAAARPAGLPAIGPDDDFFQLGGHSLLGVRVAARLRDLLGVELPLLKLLQLSRLGDLAREVERLVNAGAPPAAPLRRLPRAAPPAAEWEAPASFGQERLWFLDQLEPASATYNQPAALRFRGALDVAALAAGLRELRRRHEALRTRFVARAGGGLAALVAPAGAPCAGDAADPASPANPTGDAAALPLVDLTALPDARRAATASRLAAEEARRPFHLATGPLLRHLLLRCDSGTGAAAPAGAPATSAGGSPAASPPVAEHRLLLTMHHIVTDGWSLEVLARELAIHYRIATERRAPRPGELPALPIQYADFAAWQREWMSGEVLAAEVAFWRQQLAGAGGEPPAIALPLDRPRPTPGTQRGARRTLAIGGDLAGALTATARQHGATLFMTLLAALDTLLWRYSGETDLAVGAPVANRGRSETEPLIGLFVNTLVLRLDLAGDPSFAELLGRARQAALAAYAHQDLPFDALVAALPAQRGGAGAAQAPFFQVLFALQPAAPAIHLPHLEVEHLPTDSGTAKFDLSLAVSVAGDGAPRAATWTYRTDLFDAPTVERLGGHLRNLLAAAAAAPRRRLSELQIFAAAERHQLCVECNAAPWDDDGDDLVHAAFERRAARDPLAVALLAAPGDRDGGTNGGRRSVSYGELLHWSAAVAARLRACGVGPECIVALCAEPSCAMVAGLLGILRAGGAYLPLDLTQPRERLAQILADSGAQVLLASAAGHAAVSPPPATVTPVPLADDDDLAAPAPAPAAAAAITTAVPVHPDNAAYVLYTSGSTGTPKGVVVAHRAVVNRLRYQVAADLPAGSRVLQRTRLAFDVSIIEIFAPLAAGATVVLTEPARQQDAAYLARVAAGDRVTHLAAPPALLPALLAEPALRGHRGLRRVVLGGDRVPLDLPAHFFALMGDPPPALIARYGPTEATVSVAEWVCDPRQGASAGASACTQGVPLGRPIAGARLLVLDRAQRLVPPGAPGELCIAGTCLARGYLARPDATAAAFLPDPYAGGPRQAGGRLYRSGDLVRRRADGVLEFLGRLDRQVKIRGYRLELAEVEAALARHPGVREAAVVDRDAPGAAGRRLVAYVVARPGDAGGGGGAPDARQLRDFLAARLPSYMVPAAFVVLPRLPLNANGKLDRAALPPPEISQAGAALAAGDDAADAAGLDAPRGPLEEVLAGLWEGLLGLPRVGVGQDFFELGGHSLLATQLVSRVRDALGVELPLRALFEHPTIAAQAELVAAMAAMAASVRGAGPAPPPPPPPVARAPRPAAGMPLSFAQQGVWFLDQLEPANPLYNMAGALSLTGRLDAAALRRAIQAVVARHETLRTRFGLVDGGAVQWAAPAPEFALPIVDLAGIAGDARDAATLRLAEAEARRPFDLARPPLLRATLLRQGTERHLLVLVLHHVAGDGLSIAILAREAAALYQAFASRPAADDDAAAAAAGLATLPVQYADYAAWQRQWLAGEARAELLAFWRRQLAGLPPAIDLPIDRPRPERSRHLGGQVPARLDAATCAALRQLARRHGATPFMVLLAAFQALLARTCGQTDLAVGTPASNRPRPELEGLIGLFVNTVVLRGDLAGRPPLDQLLRRAREAALGAFAHQQLPFDAVVEELQPRRDAVRSPLFQVMLVVQPAPLPAPRLPGIDARWQPVAAGTAKYEFTLTLVPDGDAMAGDLEYDAQLFHRATASRMAAHFTTLLTAALAAPAQPFDELPLLAAGELHQLLIEPPPPPPPPLPTAPAWPPAANLAQLFALQAARTPAAVAVCHGAHHLTYAALAARAGALAAELAALGVGTESRVGLLLERSPAMVVAILAVLQAGGAYVPLDPAYPEERLRYLLADAGLRVLIGDPPARGRAAAWARQTGCALLVLGDGSTVAGPSATAATAATTATGTAATTQVAAAVAATTAGAPAAAAAYVIYTSGSTGRPKGVVVSHANVVRLFSATDGWFGFGPADVWALFHSFAFDFSVWEIWGALLYGGRLVIVPHDVSRAPEACRALLLDQGVTVLNQTPSAFYPLAQLLAGRPPAAATGDDAGLPLRLVIFGGEALEPAKLRPWFARHGDQRPRLVNMYGITETTVHVTRHRLRAGDADGNGDGGTAGTGDGGGAHPIGTAIADLCLRCLTPHLQPAPLGVAGEIHVGGPGVARGYLGRPELTAQRFLPDPWSDLPGARLYASGDLARRLPDGTLDYLGRRDHQVKVRGFRIEPGEIEAALARHPAVREAAVLARGATAEDRRLVAYLTLGGDARPGVEQLRAFLAERLPEHMVPAAYVVLPSLPMTAHGKLDRAALPEPAGRPELAVRFAAPRTRVERDLAAAWAAALDLPAVGIHDNFFVLGGDSIRSIRARAQAHARGLDFTLDQLFRHQTVALLAPHARATASSEAIAAIAASAAIGATEAIEPAAAAAETGGTPPFALVAAAARPRLAAAGMEDAYPLSLLQLAMLYHGDYDRDAGLYHIVTAVDLHGPLDAAALAHAIAGLAARHPVLRTGFDLAAYGEPAQLVWRAADAPAIPLARIDLAALPTGVQAAALAAHFAGERRRTFDWRRPPLLRFSLCALGAGRWQLRWSHHHAVLDGWSVATMLADLFACYRAATARIPQPAPPQARFADFIALERQALGSAAHQRYWRGVLRGAAAAPLPRRARRAPAGGARDVRLDARQVAGLRALAAAARVPFKSVLLAAHLWCLSTLSGRREVVSGLVANGRLEVPGSDLALGLFLNTVPLPVRLADGTWQELAQQALAAERDVLPWRRYPLAAIRRDLETPRLFSAAFNYVHFHRLDEATAASGLAVTGLRDFAETEFELAADFMLDSATGALRLRVSPAADGGPGNLDMLAIAALYQRTLAAMAGDPREAHPAAAALSPGERHQVLVEWSRQDAVPAGGASCLHARFEAAAARTPAAVALLDGDRRLLYGELDERANQLAHHLRHLGVGPEARVGVHLPRSLDLVVALLAVLKAGGAYVPVDPAYPAARRELILRQAKVAAVVTTAASDLPAGSAPVAVTLDRDRAEIARHPVRRPAAGLDARHPAYVIYTSGSTGAPKGVVVSHGSAALFCASAAAHWQLTADDRVLQFSSASFDASVEEIFTCLGQGATLALRTDAMTASTGDFLHQAAALGITVLPLPTAYWHELCRSLGSLGPMGSPAGHPAVPAGVRLVVIGGEAAARERLAEWQRAVPPAVVVLNEYGPTETTIVSLWQDVARFDLAAQPDAPVPIGRPVPGAQALLLDADLRPVPPGTEGELHLGGACLARGYLEQPAATALRFVPNPWSDTPGGRLYRTGDLARWRADGNVEFRGRTDRQVKVRGFRIELGEIEAVLRAHPAIVEAVVVVRRDASTAAHLAAWLVPAELPGPAAAFLRQLVAARLPDHMVPSRWHLVAALPHNASGKIDLAALASLEPPPSGDDEPPADAVPPRDDTELRLTAIWAQLLQLPAVSVTDDFFTLGGHSLLAVQLAARIERDFGVKLPLADIVATPTIERQAARLRRGASAGGRRSPLVPLALAMPQDAAPAAAAPLLLVHPIGGNVLCYLDLARRLGSDLPVWGLQSLPPADPAAPAPTLEQMAAVYVAAALRIQPPGAPWRLAGWSLGGVVAWEMARQLTQRGEAVELLAILDSPAPATAAAPPAAAPADGLDPSAVAAAAAAAAAGREADLACGAANDLARLAGAALTPSMVERLRSAPDAAARLARLVEVARALGAAPPGVQDADLAALCDLYRGNLAALAGYRPPPGERFAGTIQLLRASGSATPADDPTAGWSALAAAVQVEYLEGDHYSILRGAAAGILAQRLRARLDSPPSTDQAAASAGVPAGTSDSSLPRPAATR